MSVCLECSIPYQSDGHAAKACSQMEPVSPSGVQFHIDNAGFPDVNAIDNNACAKWKTEWVNFQ